MNSIPVFIFCIVANKWIVTITPFSCVYFRYSNNRLNLVGTYGRNVIQRIAVISSIK
jgi:hypothetical protein